VTLDQAIPTDVLAAAMAPRLLVGRGLLAGEIARLGGRYGLLTHPDAAAILPVAIREGALARVDVASLAGEDLAALEASLPEAPLVVGFGGGMVMDAAKYVAWRRGCRLLLAPGIVSVDASVTNTIAVRESGGVAYRGFVVADAIVVDVDLVERAPARLNRAGIGDLASIHTALVDWRLGAAVGRATFDDEVAAASAHVLARVEALAGDVFDVTERGLEAVIRGYVEVNALCLRAGHSQPEEGSEHYVGYRLEQLTGRSFVHGELIGLGGVLMATLQRNDPRRLVRLLDACGVGWRPDAQDISIETIVEALVGLPAFVRDHDYPYSIVDEAELSEPAAQAVVDRAIVDLAHLDRALFDPAPVDRASGLAT
jgi:glycerol-1-phosphate dehydrogenase [NAD(P)+]